MSLQTQVQEREHASI